MTRPVRLAVSIVILAIAGATSTKIVTHAFGVPSCHSKESIKGMIAALAKPEFGTLAVNNPVNMSGGPFTMRRCSAEIAPIRGGVDAVDMHWMRVSYQVRKADTPAEVAVTATLEGDTTLAPERSRLAQFIGSFLD
jgi:hypothetical protein